MVRRYDIPKTNFRVLFIPSEESSPNYPSVKGAIVEFYDLEHKHTPNGQFTGGRYNVATLLKNKENICQNGLNLYGGVPKWKVSGTGMACVFAWLNQCDTQEEPKDEPLLGYDAKGQILRKGQPVCLFKEVLDENGEPYVSPFEVQGLEFIPMGGFRRKEVYIVKDGAGRNFQVEVPNIYHPTPFPIYCKGDEANLQEGLYLGLLHGFKNDTEREEWEDWGSNGPIIGPLEYCHTTYAGHLKLKFTDSEHQAMFADEGEKGEENLDLYVNGDCLEYKGMFYGDWTVFYHRKDK